MRQWWRYAAAGGLAGGAVLGAALGGGAWSATVGGPRWLVAGVVAGPAPRAGASSSPGCPVRCWRTSPPPPPGVAARGWALVRRSSPGAAPARDRGAAPAGRPVDPARRRRPRRVTCARSGSRWRRRSAGDARGTAACRRADGHRRPSGRPRAPPEPGHPRCRGRRRRARGGRGRLVARTTAPPPRRSAWLAVAACYLGFGWWSEGLRLQGDNGGTTPLLGVWGRREAVAHLVHALPRCSSSSGGRRARRSTGAVGGAASGTAPGGRGGGRPRPGRPGSSARGSRRGAPARSRRSAGSRPALAFAPSPGRRSWPLVCRTRSSLAVIGGGAFCGRASPTPGRPARSSPAPSGPLPRARVGLRRVDAPRGRAPDRERHRPGQGSGAGGRGHPAYLEELTCPCCIPALGEFGEVPPRGVPDEV